MTQACWLMSPQDPDWRRRNIRLPAKRVVGELMARLSADLDGLPSSVRNIVAVVHTNPFEECLQRGPTPDPFDAYEGTTELGVRLAAQSGRRVVCIAGHRHRKLDIEVGGVRVVRSPVGYLNSSDEEDLYARAVASVGMLQF